MEHYFVFSLIFNCANCNNCFNCTNHYQLYQFNHLKCMDHIEYCQNANHINYVNWIFNRSDLFQCTDYFVSRWYYICFYFSSFSLLNRQSLLLKVRSQQFVWYFRLEFHSFEWELSSDLVLNCCLFCFTLLAAVSTNINRFQKLKYTIIYINYTESIDIYWYILWYIMIYLSNILVSIWSSYGLSLLDIDHIIPPTIILCVFCCQLVYVWFIPYLFVCLGFHINSLV